MHDSFSTWPQDIVGWPLLAALVPSAACLLLLGHQFNKGRQVEESGGSLACDDSEPAAQSDSSPKRIRGKSVQDSAAKVMGREMDIGRKSEKRQCKPQACSEVDTEALKIHAKSVSEKEMRSDLPAKAPEPNLWDSIEIDETKLSDEGRKTLMKVRRKLREIAQIEARMSNGEAVEANQRAKVEKKNELLDEIMLLAAGAESGLDHGFVTVAPGMAQGKLRTEAARKIELVQETPAKLPEPRSTDGWATPVQSSGSKKKSKKGPKKEKNDDSQGWTTVEKGKKKSTVSEEEKADRMAAIKQREAQRVQDTSTAEYERTRASLRSLRLWDESKCDGIEELIDKVVVDAQRGLFKKKTVDLTPMRNKYFFGFAYTYGAQKEHPGAHGTEAVWPPSEASPIPTWIQEQIIEPIEKAKIVPKGWINSATINDYAAGGCIVSHIDPVHLFDRPIIGCNFFSECNLVFGTTFSFPKDANDISCSTPVYVQPCQRGHVTVMKGYSANNITHAIRPCDLPSRRASIILRRVLPSAPVLLASRGICVPLRDLQAALKDSPLEQDDDDWDSEEEEENWGRNIHRPNKKGR